MIDTTQFSGDGAVLALVLAQVRYDYWYSHANSTAFRTARQFLDGVKCRHILCDSCRHEGESGWEARLCENPTRLLTPMATPIPYCGSCRHRLEYHNVYEFDWGAHRDLLLGSLGLEVAGFVSHVKSGRQQ